MNYSEQSSDLDAQAPPAPRDPLGLFARHAAARGLIQPGEPMPDGLAALCMDVVEACAKIGDQYGDPEAGGNAGEHIRFELGDL